jgi:membrane complex biogenesis BtpA family protein
MAKKVTPKQTTSTVPSLIGVIHLPPLPGSPGANHLVATQALQQAGLSAVKEAIQLQRSGFDAIILENFGDIPFYKSTVPPETVASMAIIAAAVREAVKIPIGINVLRNDAPAALAIAAVVGADFIRVNVWSGVVATDQGMVEGQSAQWLRERDRLNANDVQIFADVQVKHAQSLSSTSLSIAIEETAGRGGANAVIITGATTGRSPDFSKIIEALQATRQHPVPVYIGSGLDAKILQQLAVFLAEHQIKTQFVHAIVGSALRKSGRAGAPLDNGRIKAFVAAWKKFKNSKAPKKTKH